MAKKVFTVGNATFNSVDIEVVSMSFNHGAQANPFFADGEIYSTFAWMENVVPTASIQTADLSLAQQFTTGQQAALVQNFPQRAAGIGGKATGSTALIATWVAGTMLGALGPNGSQAGESSLALDFTGISADGTTAPVAITLSTAA